MLLPLSEIAKYIDAEIIGSSEELITGPCKIDEGQKGKITFLANEKYEPYVYDTLASAIIVSKDFTPKQQIKVSLLKVNNVYGAIATLFEKFGHKNSIANGIAEQAVVMASSSIDATARIAALAYVGERVKLGKNVTIYPHVFIDDDVEIGDDTIVYSGTKIYHGSKIGKKCIIHSNAVIGSDGFGFTPDGNGGIKKIEQLGNVVLENNVEVGSGTTIDRATMGSTIIREFVKLDNMVHIAHNVEVGEMTMIAAQTGIAGSSKLGKYCMVGGQVGIMGHIRLADRTSIQAKSGIGRNINKEGTKWYGYPAIDYNSYLRSYAYFKQLPKLEQRIRELEEKLKENKL